MKNILLLSLCLGVLLSCGKNDDGDTNIEGQCQGVIDTTPPGVFYIELVDSNGANLIENGFYDRQKISAELNGEYLDFLDVVPTEPAEINYLVVLPPIGNEDNNRWLLTLSKKDVDTLDFSMSNEEIRFLSDGSMYCGGRFILNSVSYNGRNIDMGESTTETFLEIPITVVKSVD